MQEKKSLNGGLIYVLSITSIILFCFGGVSIIFAIIALVMANKAQKYYSLNPDLYTEKSFKKVKKGKIIAIIGIVLNVIIIGITIWTLATIGWDAWSDEFVRKWNEGLENGTR